MPPSKPGVWTVNRADIDPLWQRYWDGLILAVPLFHHSVFDVIEHLSSSSSFSGYSWTSTTLGQALTADGSQSGLHMPGVPSQLRSDTVPWTVSVVVEDINIAPDDRSVLVATRASGIGWGLKAEQSTNTGNVGFTKFGVVDIDSGIDTPSGPAIISVVVNADRSVSTYVQNLTTLQFDVDNDTNTSSWTDTTVGLEIGASDDIEPLTGSISAVYAWNRAISEDDLERLGQDPFGMFRQSLFVTDASAAATVTPGVIATSVVMDSVTAFGADAIVTPAVTARSVVMDSVTPVGSAVALPAVTARSFTVDDVAQLSGPGGPISPAAVNRLTETEYEVVFAPQTASGVYALTIGPDVLDATGNQMDQDGDGTCGEALEDQFTMQFTLVSSLRFDFGTAGSPVEDGYFQISPSSNYTSATGYGMQSGFVMAADRFTGTPLSRDFLYGSDFTFAADLPNGSYDVTLTVGDESRYAHDNMAVFLEGMQVDTVSTRRREVLTIVYAGVTVADGQLTLQMTDLGGKDVNAVINGLEISPSAGGGAQAMSTGGASSDSAIADLSFHLAMQNGRQNARDALFGNVKDWRNHGAAADSLALGLLSE